MKKNYRKSLLGHFLSDRQGNVMILFGLSIVPLTFGVGFGIDYSKAMRLDAKLDAAADAASLAGVSAIMIKKSDAEARVAARAMFNKQVEGLPGLIYDATDANNPTITIASTTGVNTSRTVTVAYSAQSTNIFSGILGKSTLPINGSSTAFATRAPNIDFYLVLDTSPSMLLPVTSAGMTRMRSITSSMRSGNGCAFACHFQDVASEGLSLKDPNDASVKDIFIYKDPSTGVETFYKVTKVVSGYIYYKNSSGVEVKGPLVSAGRYADSFWAAKNYGLIDGGAPVELRVNSEQIAAQQLIPFAQNTAQQNSVTYRMKVFGFDTGDPVPLTNTLQDISSMSSASIPDLMSLQPLWYKNSWITSTNNIDDQASRFKPMFTYMNNQIPDPGLGTSDSTPQAVMFLVTDGMVDEPINGSRVFNSLRQSHLDQCTAIKNRGIRIAVLYTEYAAGALTGDSWSVTNVVPLLPDVETKLKSCASAKADGTPLFYKVSSDESIPAALSQLFSLTVSAAHLIR